MYGSMRKTGVTSASLPSVSRKCGTLLSPFTNPSVEKYLSVPFLDPIEGFIFIRAKSDVAGPSRGGHFGWIAASEAFPSSASPPDSSAAGAAGKRNRLQEEEKKSINSQARRPVFIVNRSSTCCWRRVSAVSTYRGLLACEWGLSCSRWGTTECTRPEPMSAHSLCLRSDPVCAPRSWTLFNESSFCVKGPAALFFPCCTNTECEVQRVAHLCKIHS